MIACPYCKNETIELMLSDRKLIITCDRCRRRILYAVREESWRDEYKVERDLYRLLEYR